LWQQAVLISILTAIGQIYVTTHFQKKRKFAVCGFVRNLVGPEVYLKVMEENKIFSLTGTRTINSLKD
jgi:hypothetical protein